MPLTNYDVIVIGAGVNGSSAAYSLSKRDVNALLLEQFPVPHTRGSSHGQTRVTRLTYANELYARMSRDSFPIWRELEKEVDEKLLIQNGYLEIYDDTEKGFAKTCQVLDAVGGEYKLLSSSDVNKRFPPLAIPESWHAIYEPGGGTVLASKCVNALQRAFVKRGGELRDREVVELVVPCGDTVTVVTRDREYRAKAVIITAGSFTSKLTSSLGLNLPLDVQRVYPCYWNLDDDCTMGTLKQNFPCWFTCSRLVYGFPVLEYPGMMKICGHWGEPMKEKFSAVGEECYSKIKSFIEKNITNVSTTPSVVEECIYTVTPDNNFIIDAHPLYKNVVIGAGFCGGGFKMAPVTGSVLADLALGIDVKYDIESLRIDRFKTASNIGDEEECLKRNRCIIG